MSYAVRADTVEFWQADRMMRGKPFTEDGVLNVTRAMADETLDLVGDAMGDTACIVEVLGPDGGPMLDLCPSRYADTAPAMTRH